MGVGGGEEETDRPEHEKYESCKSDQTQVSVEGKITDTENGQSFTHSLTHS